MVTVFASCQMVGEQAAPVHRPQDWQLFSWSAIPVWIEPAFSTLFAMVLRQLTMGTIAKGADVSIARPH